jgi:hypothetical protein
MSARMLIEQTTGQVASDVTLRYAPGGTRLTVAADGMTI